MQTLIARLQVAALVVAVTGCRSDGSAKGPQADLPAEGGTQLACARAASPHAIPVPTSDGIRLEADYYPSGAVGGPGVVLLHMIPPHHDKSNYSPAFISALTEAGYTVLNVNRRGAGASEGEAKEAYEGDKGRLDAEAAHTFLVESACKVPADAIAVVGASNGTTTAVDYTVAAEAGDRPPALVFLSPGDYTENQNRIAEHLDVLGTIPIFIGYPDSEAAWPELIRGLEQERWTLEEYAGGSHGTGLFETHAASISDIAGFLTANVPVGE